MEQLFGFLFYLSWTCYKSVNNSGIRLINCHKGARQEVWLAKKIVFLITLASMNKKGLFLKPGQKVEYCQH